MFDPSQNLLVPLDSVYDTGQHLSYVSEYYDGQFANGPLLVDQDLDSKLEAIDIVKDDPNESDADFSSTRISYTNNDLSLAITELPQLHQSYARSQLVAADGPSLDEGDDKGLDLYMAAHGVSGAVILNTKMMWIKPNGDIPNLIPELGWPHQLQNTEAWEIYGYAPTIANIADGDLEFVTLTGPQEGAQTIRRYKLNAAEAITPLSITGGGFEQQRRLSAATIADLDLDGDADMVLSVPTDVNHAEIHAYSLGVPYNPETIEWNGFRNGVRHTNLYAQPVSGTQVEDEIVWQGRVTVHDYYVVDVGQSLTIKPGTVVEFRPYAYIDVYGTLIAEGTEYDSIYFKPDVATEWSGVFFWTPEAVNMQYCVVHEASAISFEGGENNVFSHNHLYNMYIGLDLLTQSRDGFLCEGNLITDCYLYGLRGLFSAGIFVGNTIRNCIRSGIYWYADNSNPVESPYFEYNNVEYNGSGVNKIGGGYFNYTTAEMTCNSFRFNDPNQISLENYADVVMNGDLQYTAANTLENGTTTAWCGCTARCVCASPPSGFKPLLRIRQSLPQLSYGYNTFRLVQGTFAEDPCPRSSSVHDFTSNYYEGDGNFCRPEHFSDPDPSEGVACLQEFMAMPGGVSEEFMNAIAMERNGDFAAAASGFAELIDSFSESSEAQWALRAYLRSTLAGGSSSAAISDTLYSEWIEENNPFGLREVARHEAVWALVSGQAIGEARYELEEVTRSPINEDDSIWALAMDAALDVVESGPSTQRVGAHQAQTRDKIRDFHNRLHQIMGRPEDSEIESQTAIPNSPIITAIYPNPFNASTLIEFELRTNMHVSLELFDVLGRQVATLVDEVRNAGVQRVRWDGTSQASGIYFVRLEAGNVVETRKMVMVK